MLHRERAERVPAHQLAGAPLYRHRRANVVQRVEQLVDGAGVAPAGHACLLVFRVPISVQVSEKQTGRQVAARASRVLPTQRPTPRHGSKSRRPLQPHPRRAAWPARTPARSPAGAAPSTTRARRTCWPRPTASGRRRLWRLCRPRVTFLPRDVVPAWARRYLHVPPRAHVFVGTRCAIALARGKRAWHCGLEARGGLPARVVARVLGFCPTVQL